MHTIIKGSISKLAFEITLNPSLFPKVIAKIKNIFFIRIKFFNRLFDRMGC